MVTKIRFVFVLFAIGLLLLNPFIGRSQAVGLQLSWLDPLEDYILSLPKKFIFLYDTVNALRVKYRYAFVN